MKCEVLIGDDAEQARKEGKRLEWWSDAKASFMPHSPDSFCGSTVFRLAPEQPVPPGDLTATEARQLCEKGTAVQWRSAMCSVWYDCPHEHWPWNPIYPYRRKPETKRVPLGPEDVPPGSVVRRNNWPKARWCYIQPTDLADFALLWHGNEGPENLLLHFEISRDGGKTWGPCSKEVES